MRIPRPAIGVLLGLYTLISAWGLVTTALYRSGAIRLTGEAARFAPVMQGTAIWQIVAWTVMASLLGLATLRMFTGARAFIVFGVALAIDLLLFVLHVRTAAHARAFSPAERLGEWVLVAVLLAIGALIWFSERKPARARG